MAHPGHGRFMIDAKGRRENQAMAAFLRFLFLAWGLALAPTLQATSFSRDHTDLWFNPAESGWGLNVIQQHEIGFATLFVYGTDSSPRWYVAPALAIDSNSLTGDLYQTTGPAFNLPWTGTSGLRRVGNMTIVFNQDDTGAVQYSVDGVSVTKSIRRQTWRVNNLSGRYAGGITADPSLCSNGGGSRLRAMGVLDIQHASNASGGTVSMRLEYPEGSITRVCTFSGTNRAMGRLATVSGNFMCTGGSPTATGTFTLSDVQVTRNGLVAAYEARDNFCQYHGAFGGPRE